MSKLLFSAIALCTLCVLPLSASLDPDETRIASDGDFSVVPLAQYAAFAFSVGWCFNK